MACHDDDVTSRLDSDSGREKDNDWNSARDNHNDSDSDCDGHGDSGSDSGMDSCD